MAESSQDVVERRIQFYRLRVKADPDGRERQFDIGAAASGIGALAFTPGGRYMDWKEGATLAVWPQSVPGQTRLCIGVSRHTGLPQLERAGSVSPLAIDPSEGLLEQTHVAFFEWGIVGGEFNFYGPRLARLAAYLEEKLPEFPRVSFDPLLNIDAHEQIEHLKDVRLIDLKIRRPYVQILRDADESIGAALRATAESLQAEVLELVLSPRPYSRGSLATNPAITFLRNILSNPQLREGVERLKVKGFDDRVDEVSLMDLLQDELKVVRRVIRHDRRYRTIDSASMFDEMNAAFESPRADIFKSAGIQT